jgi:hypothetical protein
MANIDITDTSTGGGGGGSGTVTSVGLSVGTTGTNINVSGSPVTNAGTLTINIPTASATNTGRLSSTDWSTFNNKQAALVSGTNIKTVNSTTLLGSGNLAVQDVLVSGTNIKTINGNSVLGTGDLTVSGTPAGSNGYVQFNNSGTFGGDAFFYWDNGNKYLGIGTATPSGFLHIDGISSPTRLIIDADNGINRILSFRTGDLQRWALRVDTAESGSNTGANFSIRRYNDAGVFIAAPISINRATGLTTISESLNLGGSELQNFSANLETLAANTTFDAGNTATYNGSVVQVSGARTFTFDNALPLGFTMTVIQTDANQTTFVGAGSAVVNNRQSHTKNNGQYSVISIIKLNTNQFILGGDTAA